MTLDTYALLLFVAGVLAGIGLAIVLSLSRDMPWVIHRLYRFVRYRERPRDDDIPPSIRPYYDAVLSDLHRQGRLTPPPA